MSAKIAPDITFKDGPGRDIDNASYNWSFFKPNYSGAFSNTRVDPARRTYLIYPSDGNRLTYPRQHNFPATETYRTSCCNATTTYVEGRKMPSTEMATLFNQDQGRKYRRFPKRTTQVIGFRDTENGSWQSLRRQS